MAPDAPDPALAAALARITADFDAAMPDRIASLRASLAHAGAGGGAATDALVDGLHRLAGNAGTFGHAEISARARDLEVRLTDVESGGDAERPAVLSDVASFLDALSAEFDPAAGA